MKVTIPIKQCAEVAALLWQKGWAERNGGNVVVRLDEDDELRGLPPLAAGLPCGVSVPHLAGRFLFSKGAGCRMRDLANSPMDNGSIIRISPDGKSYDIVACRPIRPTSELATHLLLHDRLVSEGLPGRVTLHTHPTELVGLSHQAALCSTERLTTLLHRMIPEARLFCPRGIAVVPYAEPGSNLLAQATLEAALTHDVVLWAGHGAVAVGVDAMESFDSIDVMNKAAQIYLAFCIASSVRL